MARSMEVSKIFYAIQILFIAHSSSESEKTVRYVVKSDTQSLVLMIFFPSLLMPCKW